MMESPVPGADESLKAVGTPGEPRPNAAQVLRRFLAAVEAGELEADSAHAKALIRRIEGAVIGLEADEPN